MLTKVVLNLFSLLSITKFASIYVFMCYYIVSLYYNSHFFAYYCFSFLLFNSIWIYFIFRLISFCLHCLHVFHVLLYVNTSLPLYFAKGEQIHLCGISSPLFSLPALSLSFSLFPLCWTEIRWKRERDERGADEGMGWWEDKRMGHCFHSWKVWLCLNMRLDWWDGVCVYLWVGVCYFAARPSATVFQVTLSLCVLVVLCQLDGAFCLKLWLSCVNLLGRWQSERWKESWRGREIEGKLVSVLHHRSTEKESQHGQVD